MHTFFRLALLGLALLVPQPSFACTIPVYRYALERWELSTYDLLVFHRGLLAADVQAALKQWSAAPAKANIEITTIDLDGKLSAEQRTLWEREGNKDAAAWMLLRLQSAKVKEPSSWSGPCTTEKVRTLLTSPGRQTILGHLAGGASVVFVLLSSADADADGKGHALLRKQLPILEKRIKLPVQSDDDNGPKILLPLPLKVVLPIVVLDRNDPQEAGLVRLLLATEEGLDKEKGPIAFPIFGRGRVLGALYGKEFTDEQIYQTVNFLCKDCSCQVKELNPGVDLLLAADWPRIFDQMFEKKEVAPLPVKTAALPKETAAPRPPDAPKKAGQEPPAPPQVMSDAERVAPAWEMRGGLWIAASAAGGLVLLTGGWLVWQIRKRN